jgi:hypothetical protein
MAGGETRDPTPLRRDRHGDHAHRKGEGTGENENP